MNGNLPSLSSETINFERLCVNSIQHFTEALGYDTNVGKTVITTDALYVLTEDINYRLREIAHKAAIFMRKRMRQKLTVDDLNDAFRLSRIPAPIGHGSSDMPRLHFMKELNVFVPNEGVVDAGMLSLSRSNLQPQCRVPVLTGYMPCISEPENEKAVRSDVALTRIHEICEELVQKYLCSTLRNLKDAMEEIRAAASMHSHCSISLFKILARLVLKNKKHERVLRGFLMVAQRFSTSNVDKNCAEVVSLVQQLAEILTRTLLEDSNVESLTISLQLQIFLVLSRKFDFISSFSSEIFLQKILAILSANESNYFVARALFILNSAFDFLEILKNMEKFLPAFFNFADSISNMDFSNANDQELFFEWKRFMERFLPCLVQEMEYHGFLKIIYQKTVEAFGDQCIFNFNFEEFPEQTNDKLKKKITFSLPEQSRVKSVAEILEEHWKPSGKSDSEKVQNTQQKMSGTRKRKKRRDAADFFEFPKRLRLSHQRDIIFVFHHTQAVVRPSVTKGHSTVAKNVLNKATFLDRKVGCERRKTKVLHWMLRSPPVDVCSVIL